MPNDPEFEVVPPNDSEKLPDEKSSSNNVAASDGDRQRILANSRGKCIGFINVSWLRGDCSDTGRSNEKTRIKLVIIHVGNNQLYAMGCVGSDKYVRP